MDSLTHVVIGGCLGQVIAGKTLGRNAIILGIIGQSIPDIDFVSGLWMTESEHVLAHRGFTHSLLFAILVTIFLAFLSKHILKLPDIRLRTYVTLFSVNVFVHVLLDTCNAYGTAFFQPFSDIRFSFHLLFVADPLFSVVPGILFIWMLFSRKSMAYKNKLATGALVYCILYVMMAMVNKASISRQVEKQFAAYGKDQPATIITPTLLNTLLWYIMVQEPEGFQIGYRSVLDSNSEIHFKYFPKNDSLLQAPEDIHAAIDLIRFAEGFYTLEQRKDSLVLNILRFGQVGWQDSSNHFAFYYYLNKPEANILTIQRGRFKKMDAEGWHSFLRRVKGN